MEVDERDYLAEKRSAIRSRITKPKGVENKKLIGGALALVLIFGLVFATYSGEKNISTPQEKATPQPQKQGQAPPKPTPEPQDKEKVPAALSPASEKKPAKAIPAPKITIRSPPNATINETTPLLDVYVEGEEIDSVWVSVDGGPNITISHTDGTINYVKLNPIFAEDFSGDVSEWTPTGSWIIKNGEFIGRKGNTKIEIKPSIQSVYEFKAKFKSKLGLRSPFLGLYLVKDSKNRMVFHMYPDDSSYAPSGGFIGQREEGIWTYHQTSAPIKIEYDKWYKLKIYFEEERIKVSINELPWLSYPLQNPNKVYEDLRLVASSHAYFDDLIIYKPLQDGIHYVTVYANNTTGTITSATRHFTISTKPEKIPTIGDTITKGIFAVTLNRYSPIEDITYPRKYVGLYAMAYITVENVGKVEKDLKFDAKTVLLDDLGNQYIFKKVKRTEEIVQGTLYPGGKKSGILYFTPQMSLKAKNVKLIISLSGEKYEFEFKAF